MLQGGIVNTLKGNRRIRLTISGATPGTNVFFDDIVVSGNHHSCAALPIYMHLHNIYRKLQ